MNPQLGRKLQSIPKPVLYFVLMSIVVIGLIVPLPLPLVVGPQARSMFEAIEDAPTDKIAVVSTLWSASTQGENRPQTRVILTHLMRRKIKFVLVAFGNDAQSTTLAQELAEEMTRETGYKYGEDWLNLGYKLDMPGALKGAVVSLEEVYKTDSIFRRPLSSYPMMHKTKSLKDAGILIEVAASSGFKNWLQFVKGTSKAKLCYGCTSVMGPEMYTYLDSGQISGLLFGIKGAAEYERLLGIAGFTTRAIGPISLALIYLFGLIGLGNYGMYLQRKGSGGRGYGR
jgi:hypothetical protein